jgi:hypothetical protein
MEEISTSFCFICLLHLANEQGLKLESNANPVEDSESQTDAEGEKKVGDIWDIKVCIQVMVTVVATLRTCRYTEILLRRGQLNDLSYDIYCHISLRYSKHLSLIVLTVFLQMVALRVYITCNNTMSYCAQDLHYRYDCNECIDHDMNGWI